MFTGSYEHQVDSKGRVSIPAKFREFESGSESIKITKFKLLEGIGGCLTLVTVKAFERTEKGHPPVFGTFKEFLDYNRVFLPSAVTVSVDPQGRIVIPPNLRNKVGIAKKALIIGVGEWVEIWSPDKYNEYKENLSIEYDKMAIGFFSSLGNYKPKKIEEEPTDDTSSASDA